MNTSGMTIPPNSCVEPCQFCHRGKRTVDIGMRWIEVTCSYCGGAGRIVYPVAAKKDDGNEKDTD